MKLVLLIFAVTFGGTPQAQNAATGGLGAAAGTEESKTKPVSAPLPKESMNLQAIPYKIVHESYLRTKGKMNHELFIMNADGSGQTNLTNTPDVDEQEPSWRP